MMDLQTAVHKIKAWMFEKAPAQKETPPVEKKHNQLETVLLAMVDEIVAIREQQLTELQKSLDSLQETARSLPQRIQPTKPMCPICKEREVTDTHYRLCGVCKQTYAHEIQRVRAQKSRARRVGEPATLTIVEWLQTLQAFHNTCAYCQQSPYVVMEHFIPIGHKAGTTKENCLPACNRCNGQKSNKHPEK